MGPKCAYVWAVIAIIVISSIGVAQDETPKSPITGWHNLKFGMSKRQIILMHKDYSERDEEKQKHNIEEIGEDVIRISGTGYNTSLPEGVWYVDCFFNPESGECWAIRVYFYNTILETIVTELREKYGEELGSTQEGQYVFAPGSGLQFICTCKDESENSERILDFFRTWAKRDGKPEPKEIDVVEYGDKSRMPRKGKIPL